MPGLSVEIDGSLKGELPLDVQLSEGFHILRFFEKDFTSRASNFCRLS